MSQTQSNSGATVSIFASSGKPRKPGVGPESQLKATLSGEGLSVRAARTSPPEALAKDLKDAIESGDNFVFVLGGTGIGLGETSPETIASVADYEIPGVGERMRAESAKYSDKAFMSRSGAWRAGGTIIFAMPGGASAVTEYVTILKPMFGPLLHAMSGACDSRSIKQGAQHEHA